MGVKQILRATRARRFPRRNLISASTAVIAATCTVVATFGVAVAAPPSLRPDRALARVADKLSDPPRAIIVDRRRADDRRTSRAAFATAVAASTKAFIVADDAGLDDALSGKIVVSGDDSVDAAQGALKADDCPAALAASSDAILALSADQAATTVGDASHIATNLGRAWSYRLQCADRGGDFVVANRAAAAMRQLGVAQPSGIAVLDDALARHPDVDASTDRDIVALTVIAHHGASDIPGAAVWIDHKPVGVTPLSTFVMAGEHVIAVATAEPGNPPRGAQFITVQGKPLTAAIDIAAPSPSWPAITAALASWTSEESTASAIAQLATAANANIVIVLDDHQPSLWMVPHTRPPLPRAARRIVAPLPVMVGNGQELATAMVAALAADHATDRSPDPAVPLLTENNTDETPHRHPAWWVYASIAGAVVIAGAFIYATSTGDDHQIIHVTGP